MNFADIESEHNYRWQITHSNSVILNETLVINTAARFPAINPFGMNPGAIKTDIMSGVLGQSSLPQRMQEILVGLLFQSAETYAEKVAPLLVYRALEDRSGSLFNRNVQPIEPNPWLKSDSHLGRVVEVAEALSA
ncbi:hypothetical protein EQZ23_04340 [Sphingomonas sp. UV9]|uniref:hypothetical protein n=1 Tax=Sphingomonas sp. UV9 TaxID=1851410 RepID=UPI000FFC31E4|nr:hypothetical protein [Sphingomonas sp. UV9]RXD07291.1 hypothetical protein EQZ23_04340 [Sphingomonas sp. UV9]